MKFANEFTNLASNSKSSLDFEGFNVESRQSEETGIVSNFSGGTRIYEI